MDAELNKDCRFFRAAEPCVWNKTEGYECATCERYEPRGANVLIIKLDAIGDVLRTTCIIPKIKEKFPNSYLTWITEPESIELLLSNPDIDEVWNYDNTGTLSRVLVQHWDVLYSLDNSYTAASLAALVHAKQKRGFVQRNTEIVPTNEAASAWLEMAVFDRVKKQNTRSYQEIMYDICGFEPPICKPCIQLSQSHVEYAEVRIKRELPGWNGKYKIVGVNSGSGHRWPKKMLNTEQIVKFINTLLAKRADCYVILLGGPNEVAKNEQIADILSSDRVVNTGCNQTLLQFAALIQQCDALLCGDTLALHMASALGVPTVAVFGPTSCSEIYDYDGLVRKVRADGLNCLCCYGDCQRSKNCMALLSTDFLVEKTIEQIETACEVPKVLLNE